MKSFLVTLILLIGSVFLGTASASDSTCKEVKGVFDYETGYVQIGTAEPQSKSVIDELMAKKDAWSCKFPQKKIIALSIIYGKEFSIVGLLLLYEKP